MDYDTELELAYKHARWALKRIASKVEVKSVGKVRLDIRWDKRYTTTAATGRWYKGFGEIRLSHYLWPHATPKQRFVLSVHEACHVAQDYLWGIGNTEHHGKEWKMLMVLCGMKTDPFHHIKVKEG